MDTTLLLLESVFIIALTESHAHILILFLFYGNSHQYSREVHLFCV